MRSPGRFHLSLSCGETKIRAVVSSISSALKIPSDIITLPDASGKIPLTDVTPPASPLGPWPEHRSFDRSHLFGPIDTSTHQCRYKGFSPPTVGGNTAVQVKIGCGVVQIPMPVFSDIWPFSHSILRHLGIFRRCKRCLYCLFCRSSSLFLMLLRLCQSG